MAVNDRNEGHRPDKSDLSRGRYSSVPGFFLYRVTIASAVRYASAWIVSVVPFRAYPAGTPLVAR